MQKCIKIYFWKCPTFWSPSALKLSSSSLEGLFLLTSPLLLSYLNTLAFRKSWALLRTLYRSFIEHNGDIMTDRQHLHFLGLSKKQNIEPKKLYYFQLWNLTTPTPHYRIFHFFLKWMLPLFTISDVKDFMSNKLPSIKQLVQAVAWAH